MPGRRSTGPTLAVVDDQLYEVVGSLNDMAEQVEQLADQVDEQAQQLAVTIEQANSSAEDVETRVTEQTTPSRGGRQHPGNRGRDGGGRRDV